MSGRRTFDRNIFNVRGFQSVPALASCSPTCRYSSSRRSLFWIAAIATLSGWLGGCDSNTEFTSIRTGVTLQVPIYAWCDATHIAAYDFERINELLYVDVAGAGRVERVDLTNPDQASPARQLRAYNLHCFENQIVFNASPDLTPEARNQGNLSLSIYTLRPGQTSELVATLKEQGASGGPLYNASHRFVVGNGRMTTNVPPGIWLYAAKDHRVAQVTSGVHDQNPRISPDGDRVMFSRQEGALSQVFIAHRRQR